MKSKNKNLMLFLVFFTLLIVSIPSLNTKKSKDGVDIFNLGSSQVSWNVSEYVNFTGPSIDTDPPLYLLVFRIFIDENNVNYTWSKTAAENSWCTGSGTPGDPYIIEGLFIDGQGDSGGIYIKNSSKHFIIRNCWVNNSGSKEYDAGVLLHWAKNGIIEDNIFSYTEMGVWIEFYCSNITVSGNYMISDPVLAARALQCDYYNNDIVIDGNVIVNFYSGMYFRDVSNCTLSNSYVANFIFEEWGDPPVWFRQVNNSEVIYNTLDGVYAKTEFLVEIIGGGDNTVTDNKVGASTVDIPDIPILSADPEQDALNNRGFSLRDCYNNLIAHNRMLGGDSDLGIPGYDALLTLSLAGIVFTVLVIKIWVKKGKR